MNSTISKTTGRKATATKATKPKATLKPMDDLYDEMLRDAEIAREYLNEHLKLGDPALLRKAVGRIIKAQGGISKIARELNLNRANLSVALTEKGNPSFDLIYEVLVAMGVELTWRKSTRRNQLIQA